MTATLPTRSQWSLHHSGQRRDEARRGAFTIAEVMAAVAIMALVITTSITVLQRGFLTLDTARNLAIAGQIMQSELEKMRLNDWATVSAYPAGPTTLTIDNVFTSNSAIGNRFTLQRTMSTPKTEFLQITLTITWNSVDGRTISRSYTTYYGHYGLYDYFYNTA